MTSPAPAPELPGLTLQGRLGGGGFADVFLFREEKLRRNVAVKVLRADASSPQVEDEFLGEASLMAALSEHHNIVTIHYVGIADDGRPYMVMEYMRGPSLADKFKQGSTSVADVLAIGVQLAGAVESAHREQILHRDIKPANVLTSLTGRPALTDFGISVSTSDRPAEAAYAFSTPWTPPEVLSSDPHGDHRADIYSLAATLYTVLARRSPYELTERRIGHADLMHRIFHVPLPSLASAGIPESIDRVLGRALAKNPVARYASALEFGTELKRLQAELGHPITTLELSTEDPAALLREIPDQDDGHTKIRPLMVIRPQSAVEGTQLRASGAFSLPAPEPSGRAGGAASGAVEHTQLRGRADLGHLATPHLDRAPLSAETMQRPVPVPEPGESTTAHTRSRVPVLVATAVVVVIAAVVAVVLATKGTDPAAAPTPSTVPSAAIVAVDAVDPVTDLVGTPQGDGLVFTWKNPSGTRTDEFRWRRTDLADLPAPAVATRPTVTMKGVSRACIEVQVVRVDASLSEPTRACYPKAG